MARAHRHAVADGLRREGGLTWEKVSKNGVIAESPRTSVGACPSPMRLFACRQWRGPEKPERWSALIVTPDLVATSWSAPRVGLFYNGRQGIEATIKEGKEVFASRHLPTRHQCGIALSQDLVLLAQNLIRWFRHRFLGQTILAAAHVKELVHIGAHSRAVLRTSNGAWTLTFTGDGPWSGLTIPLRDQLAIQLELPFLDDDCLVAPHP